MPFCRKYIFDMMRSDGVINASNPLEYTINMELLPITTPPEGQHRGPSGGLWINGRDWRTRPKNAIITP